MGGCPPSPVASPSLNPAVTSKPDPPSSLAIDSAVQETLEALPMTGFPITSQQSSRPDQNDATSGEAFKKNTEVDEAEAQAAATTDRDEDSVKGDNNDPPSMLWAVHTNPMSPDQVVDLVKTIYRKIRLWESTCIESDNALDPRTYDLLDVTIFLEKIPFDKLTILQNGKKRPQDTVHKWFVKLQEDAKTGNKTPLTPEPTGDFAKAPADILGASEDACTGPHVPKKTTPQAPSSKDCLHGFMVALELRARAEKWPEHEKLARLITAELDEKSRQEVLDSEYLLGHGEDLVDKLLRDLETAKQEAEELPLSGHTKKTKPKTKQPPPVENRPLDNRDVYKKVGHDYYVRLQGTWVRSYDRDEYADLVGLHDQLIGLYHDFFRGSQHPSAIPGLRKTAKKYGMLARMWTHGIHSFLEALRHRLPESSEFLVAFILKTYHMISALQETVPAFKVIWIECKGDLARYRYAIEETDITVGKHWKNVCQEEYTRVLRNDPTVGRLYHHLAAVAIPQSPSQPDARFDALVWQLFYLTKSIVVEKPFFAAREQLLTVIDPFVAQNQKENRKATSVPQTDQDHFLTAVAYLFLASTAPEFLREHGYTVEKGQCLQTVYTALNQIRRLPCAEQVQTSRIRPSAQLGLLLCQLLLGTPPAARTRSPMMVKWAPYLATPTDRDNVATSMADATDIHDATIAIINTMVPYLLEHADTRDLRLWGFIHVILVFMRSLKTRPELLEWVREAFHAELLVPFLGMLLQNGGDRALESVAHPELTILSLGSAKMYHHANPLPEHELLRGHFFAREAGLAHYGYLAEVREQEAESYDPPLFPMGWFKGPKYDFEERRVRQDYVQDAEMCDDRSNHILSLAAQLIGVFFGLQEDKNGWHSINMPGAPPVPRPRLAKAMPEVVEWNGKSRVVFVDPSFKDVQIEKERNRRIMEENKEKMKKKKKKKKNADAIEANKKGDADKLPADTYDIINQADVDEVADFDEELEAVKVPTSTPSIALEDEGYVLISAVDLGLAEALMVPDQPSSRTKPPSTHEAEQADCKHAEGHVDKMLLVGSAPAFQGTVGSDAGVGVGAAITPVDVVQPTEGMLDTIPRAENATDAVEYQMDIKEDGLAELSFESRDEARVIWTDMLSFLWDLVDKYEDHDDEDESSDN